MGRKSIAMPTVVGPDWDPRDEDQDRTDRRARIVRRERITFGTCEGCGEAPGKIATRVSSEEEDTFTSLLCVTCTGSPDAHATVCASRKAKRMAAVAKARRGRREREAQMVARAADPSFAPPSPIAGMRRAPSPVTAKGARDFARKPRG